MRQRVAFLRTLLSGKPVLCLDEPFASLDALTRREMQEWLAGALVREPRTVLLVTHDVEEAVLLADRVVVLSPRPGRVVAELAVDRPATAQARRPGAGRPARARAGGPARMIARVLAPVLLVLGFLGAWQAYAGLADVDDFILPAPTEVGRALVDDRALLWDNLLVTAQEVGLGILVALVLGAGLAVALHFSGALRRGVYPLLVASQAVPDRRHRAAARRVVRLRDPPQAGRSSPWSASSRSSSRRSTRWPRSTPTSSSCCARWTPRAGRRSAGPRRPRRCPPR